MPATDGTEEGGTPPLHICQATPYYAPHVGGVESHVRAVARELVGRGHTVSVLTARTPDTEAYEVLDGIRVHRVPTAFTVFNTPVMPRLASVLAHLDFDVVHAHTPPPVTAYYAARGAQRSGVPLVLTHHADLEVPVPGGAALVWLYRATLGRRAVDAADRLVATTETYRATSEALWDRDVRVVPNPIDADRFAPDGPHAGVRDRLGLTEDAFVALYVGRLVHHKGIEQFLKAAAHTPDRVHHVVAGDGPLRSRLETAAHGVDAPARGRPEVLRRRDGSASFGRVHLLGRVPEADLPGLYREADCLVLPSVSRLEAFGIVALEAMASGVPVVVSDIPGVREVLEPDVTGLVAAPLDPKDLAGRIVQLADAPDRARSMGKRGRQRVLERFTVGRVVDDLERIYAEVAGSGR